MRKFTLRSFYGTLLAFAFSLASTKSSYAQYCIPTSEYGCGLDDDYINSFTLTGENSTAIDDSNTGCSANAYDDKTTLPAVDLAQGGTYSSAMSAGISNDYAAIWIDFNDDNVFESGELAGFLNGDGVNDVSLTSIDVVIPTTAPLGNHRMRVSLYYGYIDGAESITSANITPCNDVAQPYLSGETQDYTINVVSPSTPLSIILKSISAQNIGRANMISWSTGTEDAGDYFELERSADGRNFNLLTRIASHQKSSDYTFNDNNPLGGVNFYRLKMMGADGTFDYSKVVEAKVSGNIETGIAVFPNPTSKNITIKAYGTANGQVSLTDISGRVLYKATMNGTAMNIDMSSFLKGFYLIHYTDSHLNKVIKVNKQ